ncbi:MAG: YqeG family HAD IIIA-type phosphatase [Acholeplasmataceae bacterium]|jgi:HAD superfamily phosphatase (TIGR01668 family)
MINKVPNYFYEDIYKIDYIKLKDKGINTLFFDLDNTLIPYDVKYIPEKLIQFLKQLEEEFKILIITNNNYKRTRLAVGNNFKFLASAKKPFKKCYYKALNLTNSQISEVCAIGDQMMTDVIGAKKLGIKTILVNPIDPKSEGIPTKINRFRESRLLKKIKRNDPELYDERIQSFRE